MWLVFNWVTEFTCSARALFCVPCFNSNQASNFHSTRFLVLWLLVLLLLLLLVFRCSPRSSFQRNSFMERKLIIGSNSAQFESSVILVMMLFNCWWFKSNAKQLIECRLTFACVVEKSRKRIKLSFSRWFFFSLVLLISFGFGVMTEPLNKQSVRENLYKNIRSI